MMVTVLIPIALFSGNILTNNVIINKNENLTLIIYFVKSCTIQL